MALVETIKEAMAILGQMPMGAVGPEGPTLDQLNQYVEDTGESWERDSTYHTAQLAWRTLEAGLKEHEG